MIGAAVFGCLAAIGLAVVIAILTGATGPTSAVSPAPMTTARSTAGCTAATEGRPR